MRPPPRPPEARPCTQSYLLFPACQRVRTVSPLWGWQGRAAEAQRNGEVVHLQERPANPESVPSWLNWDLWLGPAPERPFHGVYVPGPKWYRWGDFGNGTMSDLGSHWIDLPFWALKLKVPVTIEASGPPAKKGTVPLPQGDSPLFRGPHPEIAPASMSATYTYGPRGGLPAVTLTWHQGENKPTIWKDGGIPKWQNGVVFIGDKGMILADYGKHLLLPEKDFAGYIRPPKMPSSPGHHAEWIAACKGAKPSLADFEC